MCCVWVGSFSFKGLPALLYPRDLYDKLTARRCVPDRARHAGRPGRALARYKAGEIAATNAFDSNVRRPVRSDLHSATLGVDPLFAFWALQLRDCERGASNSAIFRPALFTTLGSGALDAGLARRAGEFFRGGPLFPFQGGLLGGGFLHRFLCWCARHFASFGGVCVNSYF